jgi:hypothetical protein
MAYDIDLEDRIDRLASRVGNPVKKKMFGGVGYLLNGNLCFGIHKHDLILRASPETCDKLLENDEIQPFDITGKPMKGWLLVSLDAIETEGQLLKMLRIGGNFAKTLPVKR